MSRVRAAETSPVEEPAEEQEKPHLALVETAEDETLASTDEAQPVEEASEVLEAEPADLGAMFGSIRSRSIFETVDFALPCSP